MARPTNSSRNKTGLDELRSLCESDLWTFARWVNPNRVYGQIHKEMFDFLSKPDAKPDQLLLIPRAHMKSHIIVVWTAWWITKNPATTILYLSATATLAESQLYALKNMLTSKQYVQLWPEMCQPDEGKREVWRVDGIAVDHPKRKEEGIRDLTVRAAGIGTTTTGQHYDVVINDDVVVPDNAYTEEGRRKVAAAMSQMSSILNPGGFTKAVGTRYHPRDQYYIWKEQKVKLYDDDDNVIGEEPVWEIMEKVVEEYGVFLWPREQREDGQWFGFDRRTLASIEAKYTDRTQFFAQYYNQPNDVSLQKISHDKFQYYDPKFLKYINGSWEMKGHKLNIYASIDFAFSLNRAADSTAIVVIGINSEGHIYILDIDRFKADKISTYFEHISELHSKWDFRKIRAEVTVAQAIIVRDLKDHITKQGMALSIDEHRPTGKKEERISAILEHRYDNLSMWHFRGGFTSILEDELTQQNPPHDDIKDALAAAVEIAVKPMQKRARDERNRKIIYNSRFGGVG